MATSKKQVLKRLLSLTLVVAMCFSFIPIPAQAASTPATLTNGAPVTEANVLLLIEKYRNGKEPGEKAKAAGFTSYVDGAIYDAYDPVYRILFPDGYHRGIECAKFAFAFFDDIFGSETPIREVTNPADIRPGDMIHFSGHWCIATEKAVYDDKHDCFLATDVGGGASGQIDWGDGSNINRALAFYTRYPLPWTFDQPSLFYSVTAPIGSSLSDLSDEYGLDTEAHLYASKDGVNQDFFIPIIWDEAGEHNPWEHGTQTISGRLDITDYPELADSKLPTVTADISLEGSIGVTDVSVAAPRMITANYGTSWTDLNAPDTLTATITYADGSTLEEDVRVTWDFLSYSGQIGTQTVKGVIVIDDSNEILGVPEMSAWAEKLRNDGAELTVLIQNVGTGVTVLGEPFEATGFLGDAFSALNGVPNTVMVNPQLASGGATEPWEIMVNWDTSAYDPLKEEQTITGKLNFSGFVEEFPETTVTLHISLAINPNEAVNSITLISPLTISGVLGVTFDQQPLPEKVTVRVTYASGRTAELEANVSWDGSRFDANSNGDQQIPGTVSFSNGEIPEDTDPTKLLITTSINLQIRGTGITVEEIAPLKGYLGASVDEFRSRAPSLLKATVTTSTGASPEYELPVTWDWRTFDPTLEEQVIHGTLFMGGDPSIENLPSPDVQLRILLSEKPTYAADFEKVYDGKQTALPVEKPEGCTGVSIRYAGTTVAGAAVQGTRAPSEAGTYTATVTLTMAPGYNAGDPLTVNYIIHQAEQPFDTPVMVASMSDSIAVTAITGTKYGVEYKIDDGEWQDRNIFTGLKPETTYTVYQRLKASPDGNYKASEPTSVQVTTTKTGSASISIPFSPRFESKTYDGAGLFDGMGSKWYELTFGGNTVRVTIAAYLSPDIDPTSLPQNYDESSEVKNPTTAAPYVIRYTLPAGYVWADTGAQTICDGLWIYPAFSDIYVGDTPADVTLSGGTPDSNSTPSAGHGMHFSPSSNNPFDTSKAGTSSIFTEVSTGTAVTLCKFPVTVLPWVITEKDAPTVKIANDAIFDASMLPVTVAVTAKAHDREKIFQVPVTWDTAGFDVSKDTQTIPGTLDFSGIAELEGIPDTSISIIVTRLAASIYVPAGDPLADVTYSGTGLFDAGKDYTVEVDGVEIPVQVTAYLGSADTAVENPTAAGKYTIRTVLPDGYFWEGSMSPVKESTVWIYPLSFYHGCAAKENIYMSREHVLEETGSLVCRKIPLGDLQAPQITGAGHRLRLAQILHSSNSSYARRQQVHTANKGARFRRNGLLCLPCNTAE